MKTKTIPQLEAKQLFPSSSQKTWFYNGHCFDSKTGKTESALIMHDHPRYEKACLEQLKEWRESPIKIVRHTALLYLHEKKMNELKNQES